MTNRLIITALVFLIAGMLPPLLAALVLRIRFIGGVWAAILISLVASFGGGLIDTFFLDSVPDLITIGGAVDAGPPLVIAILATVIYGLVSRSNSN